jgi:hypothetical protein
MLKDGPLHAWVIPAGQRRRGEAANLVNLLRQQGIEVHTANSAFAAGKVQAAAGDYVVQMDQPYSRCAINFLDTQAFSPANPNPYDDTGWAIPLLRNVKVAKVEDKAALDQPMTLLAADAKVPGTIAGSGSVVIVDHNGDTSLPSFRFANKGVKMLAAEESFEAAAGCHDPAAAAICIGCLPGPYFHKGKVVPSVEKRRQV